MRVLIAAGRLDRAEQFVTGIDVTAKRDSSCVLSAKPFSPRPRGDYDKAQDLYRDVVQRWAEYGSCWRRASPSRTARCLIDLGDGRVATEPLFKARAIFERLGTTPLRQEVDDYLSDMKAVRS